MLKHVLKHVRPNLAGTKKLTLIQVVVTSREPLSTMCRFVIIVNYTVRCIAMILCNTGKINEVLFEQKANNSFFQCLDSFTFKDLE